MNPLVIIPARGGSKGVPHKNIKLLNNKPLIQYTIEAARNVFEDKFICVSTDDIQIKEVVENIGLNVPFLRPYELATDTAGTYEVIMHAVDFYIKKGYIPDTVILLQATSPFRTGIHIKEALNTYNNNICEMLVSVKETKSNPYFVLREENSEGWLVGMNDDSFTRRQDCPKVYEINGAIYIINYDSLKNNPINKIKKVKKYLMNIQDSIDIDTNFDWQFAEFLIKNVF